jgi:hypothetical protein
MKPTVVAPAQGSPLAALADPTELAIGIPDSDNTISAMTAILVREVARPHVLFHPVDLLPKVFIFMVST